MVDLRPAPTALTAKEGDLLVPFSRVTGVETWNRFAAVNEEFVDIHMDDDAGRAAGYSGAIGMGNLQVAYLHTVLRAFLGPGGRLTQLRCTFRAPNLKGQRVYARGRVTSVTDDAAERTVGLEVWIEDDSGAILCPGTATVTVPRDGAATPNGEEGS